MLVGTGGIVVAMRTIPTVAKKGWVFSNYCKLPHGSRPMNLMDYKYIWYRVKWRNGTEIIMHMGTNIAPYMTHRRNILSKL